VVWVRTGLSSGGGESSINGRMTLSLQQKWGRGRNPPQEKIAECLNRERPSSGRLSLEVVWKKSDKCPSRFLDDLSRQKKNKQSVVVDQEKRG